MLAIDTRQSGRVCTVDAQTWGTIASVVAVGLTVIGMLGKKIDTIDTKIDSTRAELHSRIDKSREELKDEIAVSGWTIGSQTILDFFAHPPE